MKKTTELTETEPMDAKSILAGLLQAMQDGDLRRIAECYSLQQSLPFLDMTAFQRQAESLVIRWKAQIERAHSHREKLQQNLSRQEETFRNRGQNFGLRLAGDSRPELSSLLREANLRIQAMEGGLHHAELHVDVIKRIVRRFTHDGAPLQEWTRHAMRLREEEQKAEELFCQLAQQEEADTLKEVTV